MAWQKFAIVNNKKVKYHLAILCLSWSAEMEAWILVWAQPSEQPFVVTDSLYLSTTMAVI